MHAILIILQYAGIVIIGLAVAVVIMCLFAFAGAWAEVKSRPRESMEWCHKHGHFRKGHALRLPGTEAVICPRCYMGAIQSVDGKSLHLFRTLKDSVKGAKVQ
jgi:hypothetical protein